MAPVSVGLLEFTPPICPSPSPAGRPLPQLLFLFLGPVLTGSGSFTNTQPAVGGCLRKVEGAPVCLATVCCLLAVIRGEAPGLNEQAQTQSSIPGREKWGLSGVPGW